MAFELNPFIAKKKFFIETFQNADRSGLEVELNSRLGEIFLDPDNYDTAEVKFWGGTDGDDFFGSISYYQVYQNSPDAEP